MGFLYIIGGSPIIYTITLAIVTLIDNKYVKKNTELKKFINNYATIICLCLTFLILILSDNDGSLGSAFGLIGLITIPLLVIFQFMLKAIIEIENTPWQEIMNVDSTGKNEITWKANSENNMNFYNAYDSMIKFFKEMKNIILVKSKKPETESVTETETY